MAKRPAKTTKATKTRIALWGWGVTLGYGFIDAKAFKTLTTSTMDFLDCADMASEMDMLGPDPEKFALVVNGKEVCKSIDDLRKQFTVEDADPTAVEFPSRKRYCLMTIEEEKGDWWWLDIDGKFEKSKLTFVVHQLEIASYGTAAEWITPVYDGKDFERGETEQASAYAFVFDKDDDQYQIELE